jgi:hypothetical protein
MRIDAADLAGFFRMEQGCGKEETGKDSIHSLMKAQTFTAWQDLPLTLRGNGLHFAPWLNL